MKRTYRGSCHCGAVRVERRLDLAPAGERSEPERPGVWWTSTFRCSCSWCAKTRFWKAFVAEGEFIGSPAPVPPVRALCALPCGPTAGEHSCRFTLLAGDEALTEYVFGAGEILHRFCSRCGVHPFASATLEAMGGAFHAVNVACLDDATPAELDRAPITYEDGRNDAWERPPEHTRHL